MKKGRRRGDPSECLGDGPVRDRSGRRPNQECFCEGSALQRMGLPTVRTPLSNIALDTGPPPFACFGCGEVGTESAAVKLFRVLPAQFLDDDAKRHQGQYCNSKLDAPVCKRKRHPERQDGSEPQQRQGDICPAHVVSGLCERKPCRERDREEDCRVDRRARSATK